VTLETALLREKSPEAAGRDWITLSLLLKGRIVVFGLYDRGERGTGRGERKGPGGAVRGQLKTKLGPPAAACTDSWRGDWEKGVGERSHTLVKHPAR